MRRGHWQGSHTHPGKGPGPGGGRAGGFTEVGEGPAAQAAGPACKRVITVTAPISAGALTEWADAEDRHPRHCQLKRRGQPRATQ